MSLKCVHFQSCTFLIDFVAIFRRNMEAVQKSPESMQYCGTQDSVYIAEQMLMSRLLGSDGSACNSCFFEA